MTYSYSPNPNQSHPPKPMRTPRFDMFESNTKYYIRISLPGVNKEDVSVWINEQGVLEVKGLVRSPLHPSFNQVVAQEIYHGPFHRKIKLKSNVDRQKVEFDYKGGILEVYLQKNK